jgi:signal transduction histidine kinase
VPGRDSKGRGLGLAIAREVCERSGWLICFQQVDPRGLRIIVDTSPGTSPDSIPLLGLHSSVQGK